MSSGIRQPRPEESESVLRTVERDLPSAFDSADSEVRRRIQALREAMESDRALVLIAESPSGQLEGICVAKENVDTVRFGRRVWIEDLLVIASATTALNTQREMLEEVGKWARQHKATHVVFSQHELSKLNENVLQHLPPDSQCTLYGWKL